MAEASMLDLRAGMVLLICRHQIAVRQALHLLRRQVRKACLARSKRARGFVGAGLLAIAVGQLKNTYLTHRNREQARSHSLTEFGL
ncbi:hypothetical protein ALQ18_01891 [Pseudomonas marginalis pv. marginalis]|nr:hypothetical protein ALQ18_01891 [Pseudomonas marginalis pv. marginalis]